MNIYQLLVGPFTLATCMTALIFAIMHWPGLYGLPLAGGLAEVASALIAGLVFKLLREYSGSILPGLGLHIMGNSLGF